MYELERRAPDFAKSGAYVVAVGYESGEVGRRTAANNGIRSYPLLQEGPPHNFLRRVGLWSDMMQMPFMGYVIVDTSGRIVDREQVLSEAAGSANDSIDRILRALEDSRRLPP